MVEKKSYTICRKIVEKEFLRNFKFSSLESMKDSVMNSQVNNIVVEVFDS